ncbi:MAG: hypothetical protein KBF63_02520 [Rhodoferax sp.]|nr:hypothetical protein [Rhodoferax sp.]MBP9928120.1 hypothetical protein [Rhodoferax sp.]HQX59578.1 hypothetical protein [Burkholderiaceae bacterium]HRA63685.1 hypothetical protein [Burkholderiaceae bacterium]
MLLFVIAVKLLAEIAMMALLGQWLLGKLAGERRGQNLFYQLLGVVARPAVALARRLATGPVAQRHLPLVAFLLLSVIWLAATLSKIRLCVEIGVALCR